ncbi:hypothetical protein KUH03_05315 [Sphingobacterium sp. E70]|uniref:hypothetical protein n=1 Tax=Sphingobacterium sp. E70 TaxID=2853439 RepID=UPI00211B9985|nr:hypothetical protein [Sphingobacterium sp. E70]ULT26333.1 hypothetical protein KUH03_05315 [Sphingobacterium sp. E70]
MGASGCAKLPTDYVNPFIGTSNYGTTNPGAQVPHGLMNVSPFNVMGSSLNAFDKDARWWSTPYEHSNSYFTGFSHVNLSGVGCPDMGSLLLMPTAGKLEVDYHQYGSTYTQEEAHPGYYSNVLKNTVSKLRHPQLLVWVYLNLLSLKGRLIFYSI